MMSNVTKAVYSKAFRNFSVNLLRAVFTFLLVKFIAVYGGPSSMASFSNYQNLVGILVLFATLSVQTGITVSAAKDCDNYAPFIATVRVLLLGSPLVIVGSYVLSHYMVLQNDVLSTGAYFFYSIVLVIPFSLNILFCAFEIGRQRYLGMFISCFFIGGIPCVYLLFFGNEASLMNILMSVCVANWIGLLFFLIYLRFNPLQIFPLKIDFKVLVPLLHYGIMSGLLGLLAAVTAIGTRYYVSKYVGIDAAGNLDALFKISILFQFILSAPILSAGLPMVVKTLSKGPVDLKLMLYKKLNLMVLFFTVAAFLSWCFADTLISLVLSSEFSSISDLLLFAICIEALKAFAGVFWLVPLAQKKLMIGMVNNVFFTINIFIGLYVMSFIDMLSVRNVLILYILASIVYCLIIFTWTSRWMVLNQKKYY